MGYRLLRGLRAPGSGILNRCLSRSPVVVPFFASAGVDLRETALPLMKPAALTCTVAKSVLPNPRNSTRSICLGTARTGTADAVAGHIDQNVVEEARWPQRCS